MIGNKLNKLRLDLNETRGKDKCDGDKQCDGVHGDGGDDDVTVPMCGRIIQNMRTKRKN